MCSRAACAAGRSSIWTRRRKPSPRPSSGPRPWRASMSRAFRSAPRAANWPAIASPPRFRWAPGRSPMATCRAPSPRPWRRFAFPAASRSTCCRSPGRSTARRACAIRAPCSAAPWGWNCWSSRSTRTSSTPWPTASSAPTSASRAWSPRPSPRPWRPWKRTRWTWARSASTWAAARPPSRCSTTAPCATSTAWPSAADT